MDATEWEDRMFRAEKLKKHTKPPRYPTDAELYLTNFWVPQVGNIVFSAEEAPGEEYQILTISKKNPEQAKVKNSDNQLQIIYLQDWNWAPRNEELDEVLKKFGVRVLDDCVMRNRVTLAKPKTPEEYVKVIREIRKYCIIDGKDFIGGGDVSAKTR